jgi:lysophospholipase L1-like esterase
LRGEEDVLRQLDSRTDVIDHVRSADVIEIEVGANDVAFSKSCGTDVGCFAPPRSQDRDEPRRDREPRPQLGVRPQGSRRPARLLERLARRPVRGCERRAYVAAAEQVTDDVNRVIKSTAAEDRVGLCRSPCRVEEAGLRLRRDALPPSDGGHPNAAGHEQIATATEAVIEKSLHL